MFKIAMICLVLCTAVLLIPRYNLYEQDGTWSKQYVLRQKGFWQRESCERVGRHFDDPYHCVITNTWQGIWGREVEVKE